MRTPSSDSAVTQLLDRCLLLADAALYTHLRSKNLTAELYAFPCKSLAWQ
jgi:cell cycle arrest protein BUB2